MNDDQLSNIQYWFWFFAGFRKRSIFVYNVM